MKPPTISCWISFGIAVVALGMSIAAFSIALVLLTGEVGRIHG